MKIYIKSIPQKEQRYKTLGDYWFHEPDLTNIRVSDMGNEDYEFLVALHELIESYLVGKRGISEPAITIFDIEFEKVNEGNDEPGDDPNAPYYKEHQFASAIERLMCNELDIQWFDYDNAVNELFNEEQ